MLVLNRAQIEIKAIVLEYSLYTSMYDPAILVRSDLFVS